RVQRLPAGAARDAAELRVRIALGPVLVATRGWFGEEVSENYERAMTLCAASGPCPEAAVARYGLATVTELRGEYERTEELLLPLVEPGSESLLLEARELLACSTFHQGEFGRTMENARTVLDTWDGEAFSVHLPRMAE